MNTFGEKLKKARKSKRLRQADLAKNIGISQTTIANYEGGVRFPKEAILKKLSEELEVSLDYLLSTVDPLGLERDPEEDQALTFLLTASFEEIQERYLDLLLKGEQKEATDLILNTLRIGRTVEDIYTEILAPALVQVGERWQQGNIHVAQEHYVSEATQSIMAQIQSAQTPDRRKKRWIIILSVGGERHSIGAKMVADFFSKDGWHVYYLGTNIPTDSIIQSITDLRPDLLAISVTVPIHTNTAADLISILRQHPCCENLKILVGGLAFNQSPELWKTLGADGYGKNAREAVTLANLLFPE